MVANALQPTVPGRFSTSLTAGPANSAQVSTLEGLSKQPTAVEQQKIADLQEHFQQQAQKDPAAFRTALREAFGDKASLAQIDQLLDMALSGELSMPSKIQFVEAGSLGSGALGAYDASDGGSLYLDSSLQSDPDKLQSVFNEEMGHHLDALLGGADAAGDEGAVFALTLEQGPLSQSELNALKSENDHGVIEIEGRWVEVEFHAEGGGGSGGEGGAGGGDSGSGSGSGEGAGAGDGAGSGGDAGSSGGADSGGGAGTSGSSDSGNGGECSSGSGSDSSGSSGSDAAGDSSGDSGSGDTGGECGIGDGNDTGDTQNADGTDNDNDNDSQQNERSDSDIASTHAPSEAETDSAITALGYAGAAIGALDARNQTAVDGLTEAQQPDGVKGLNKVAGVTLNAASRSIEFAEIGLAYNHAVQRAASEDADLGEQFASGLAAVAKRADNIGYTTLGGAWGLAFSAGNPYAGVGAAALVAEVYGGSPTDLAFDASVDALVGRFGSSDTEVEGYTQPEIPAGAGWESLRYAW